MMIDNMTSDGLSVVAVMIIADYRLVLIDDEIGDRKGRISTSR